MSDHANKRMGSLTGRYYVQFANLGLAGLLFIIFPFIYTFSASVAIFVCASMMTTWSVGSTSALLPYVDRAATGSVAGIVGFCGGLGGILFIHLTSTLGDTYGFVIMGILVILAACLSFLLRLDDSIEVAVTKDEQDSVSSV